MSCTHHIMQELRDRCVLCERDTLRVELARVTARAERAEAERDRLRNGIRCALSLVTARATVALPPAAFSMVVGLMLQELQAALAAEEGDDA